MLSGTDKSLPGSVIQQSVQQERWVGGRAPVGDFQAHTLQCRKSYKKRREWQSVIMCVQSCISPQYPVLSQLRCDVIPSCSIDEKADVLNGFIARIFISTLPLFMLLKLAIETDLPLPNTLMTTCLQGQIAHDGFFGTHEIMCSMFCAVDFSQCQTHGRQ